MKKNVKQQYAIVDSEDCFLMGWYDTPEEAIRVFQQDFHLYSTDCKYYIVAKNVSDYMEIITGGPKLVLRREGSK